MTGCCPSWLIGVADPDPKYLLARASISLTFHANDLKAHALYVQSAREHVSSYFVTHRGSMLQVHALEHPLRFRQQSSCTRFKFVLSIQDSAHATLANITEAVLEEFGK